MVSDVPLGAFLSGGIDSSIIVGLMARNSDRPVETFTIGFEQKEYDERERARIAAELIRRVSRLRTLRFCRHILYHVSQPIV